MRGKTLNQTMPKENGCGKNILHFENSKISTKCSFESSSTDKNSDCWISILRLKSGLVRMDSLFIDNTYSTLIWCKKILHYSIHSNTIKDGYYPLNSEPVDNTHERHAVVTTFRRAQKSLRNLSSMKKSKFSTLILSPCDLSGKKVHDFDSFEQNPNSQFSIDSVSTNTSLRALDTQILFALWWWGLSHIRLSQNPTVQSTDESCLKYKDKYKYKHACKPC